MYLPFIKGPKQEGIKTQKNIEIRIWKIALQKVHSNSFFFKCMKYTVEITVHKMIKNNISEKLHNLNSTFLLLLFFMLPFVKGTKVNKFIQFKANLFNLKLFQF